MLLCYSLSPQGTDYYIEVNQVSPIDGHLFSGQGEDGGACLIGDVHDDLVPYVSVVVTFLVGNQIVGSVNAGASVSQ